MRRRERASRCASHSGAMNTAEKGRALEESIFALLDREIGEGRFWAKPECCRLHRQKGYFSKDRGSEIVFDLAIEVFLPGEVDHSVLVLIECKNYQGAVSVGHVEEFFAKATQVAGAKVKAVVASASPFQQAAFAFAKSKGIGLLRYFGRGEFKWDLKRSPSAWAGGPESADQSADILRAMSDPLYRSEYFDLYGCSPRSFTKSTNQFFGQLLLADASEETAAHLARCANPRKDLRARIKYLGEEEIEAAAQAVHARIGYSDGAVDLQAVCEWQATECGLVVEWGGVYPDAVEGGEVLGVLSFEPLRIAVFTAHSMKPERNRFTLAHELGHLLLGHGDFMNGEYIQERDLEAEAPLSLEYRDLRRMEVQANLFASFLLLPIDTFGRGFFEGITRLGIRDRGFGPLYLDNQPANEANYAAVTATLQKKFDVSRTVVTMRLKKLGWLKDGRT